MGEEPPLQQPQQQHSGPSALVGASDDAGTAAPKDSNAPDDELIFPIDQIEALAAFCEHEHVNAEAIHVHFYPFGGIAPAVKMVNDLRCGAWPPL